MSAMSQEEADKQATVIEIKKLRDVLSSKTDEILTNIVNQTYEHVKDNTKPHGEDLKQIHKDLEPIDLRGVFRALNMLKGKSATGAYVPVATGSTPFPTYGPAKGFQAGITSAKKLALASAGSGIRNVFSNMGFGPYPRRGGGHTRRNLRRNLRKRTNKVKHRH